MEWRNKLGLYGAYFCGMAGIGFTLPYLPLYLRGEGFSDKGISFVSALAALAGVAQFPIGLWSDKLGRRKPFLLVLLGLLAAATALLPLTHGLLLVGLLVLLFAENGVCRATVESLAGAEATHLAKPGEVGAALGALRVWRPAAIVTVALASIGLSGKLGVSGLLMPLAAVQGLAVVLALLIRENRGKDAPTRGAAHDREDASRSNGKGLRDATLWVFVVAMVLFHFCNAPAGVYLGLFMKQDLGTAEGLLPVAFVVSMITWGLAVRAAGKLSDRIGRRPLLIAAWGIMTARLALLAVAQATWQALAIQLLDGLGQALFAVLAAAWVTDRLADPRRAGEAQGLVGSALVFGSAVGHLHFWPASEQWRRRWSSQKCQKPSEQAARQMLSVDLHDVLRDIELRRVGLAATGAVRYRRPVLKFARMKDEPTQFVSDEDTHHLLYLPAVNPGWFAVGGEKNVPKHGCYVGRYCNTYVWVPSENLEMLTKFTLAILDIHTFRSARIGGSRIQPGLLPRY